MRTRRVLLATLSCDPPSNLTASMLPPGVAFRMFAFWMFARTSPVSLRGRLLPNDCAGASVHSGMVVGVVARLTVSSVFAREKIPSKATGISNGLYNRDILWAFFDI